MASPLRVGVIGVGFGATVHIPGFQSEGVEVVAVCASREERARAAAERFSIPNVFTNYRELIAHPEIDAVSVVTAPNMHYEMTKAAMQAGKHVMCEKPFTTNATEAMDLLSIARRREVTHMITHEFRFAPERAYTKQLIDEGQIGEPRHITATMHLRFARRPSPTTTPPPPSEGSGGMLGALGSHFIDAMRHWFGDITRVNGTLHGEPPAGYGLEDSNSGFGIHMDFANGAWGTLTCSLDAPLGQGTSIQIYGTEGSIHLDQTGTNPASDGVVRLGRLDDPSRELRAMPIPDEFHPFDDDRDDRLLPFRLQVREFVRGIETGTAPAPNFQDGLQCQRVMDAVQESHATGTAVAVMRR